MITMARTPPALVSCQRLASLMKNKQNKLKILDGTFHKPSDNRNAHSEYVRKHIPGAAFFDIDVCADRKSRYDHMLPSPDVFSCYVSELGVSNSDHVVIYDNNETYGLFSAPRVWWMFRVYGHYDVSVLDGGLPRWTAERLPVTDQVVAQPFTSYKASEKDDKLVARFEDIEENILADNKHFTVIDARRYNSYHGVSTTNTGVRPGHMPSAVHLPYPSILDPDTKLMKTPEQLRNTFQEAGVDVQQPLVASCGSGVTACMLAFAAFQCGVQDIPVYDGSWEEWFKRARPQHKIKVPDT